MWQRDRYIATYLENRQDDKMHLGKEKYDTNTASPTTQTFELNVIKIYRTVNNTLITRPHRLHLYK